LSHRPGPEPVEDEFLAELKQLEGMPASVLDDPELLALAMPAMRGDARLYRNYIYQPDTPLPFPIFAYGGDRDPNVQAHHVEAWREQTSGPFIARQFPGGHFFPQTDAADFLPQFASDLGALSR
jgi:surfactin synthase thioesterase subunit